MKTQAKGRVERAHGTLQDRLIKLMRLDGISSMEEGNKYLEGFRANYNNRFAKEPREPKDAHRELPERIDLNKILCRKVERKISKSLEIQYKHKTLQLVAKNNGRRMIGKVVQIFELDNEIKIEFEGQEYDYTVFEDQPYQERVMDRKRVDAFLDRNKSMSIVERHRKEIAVNF